MTCSNYLLYIEFSIRANKFAKGKQASEYELCDCLTIFRSMTAHHVKLKFNFNSAVNSFICISVCFAVF